MGKTRILVLVHQSAVRLSTSFERGRRHCRYGLVEQTQNSFTDIEYICRILYSSLSLLQVSCGRIDIHHSLRDPNHNLSRVLPFAQVLHSLLRLLKRKDSVDMRPNLIRLYEPEHVFVQLFRSDVDPTMDVTRTRASSAYCYDSKQRMRGDVVQHVWHEHGNVREDQGKID